MPPTGYFCLPFPSLLKIRVLCTFLQASRNINQHQLRFLTPLRHHKLCFSDENRSSPDRHRGSNRGDWKFPAISCSELPSHCFFCPKWQIQHAEESNASVGGAFQSIWVMWGTHTTLWSLLLGNLQLPGPQPVHPCGQRRVAFPILVTADQIVVVIWVRRGAIPAWLLPFRS